MNSRATKVLDGPWRFRPDPDDRGRAERWFDGEPPGDSTLDDAPAPRDIALWCFHRFDAPAEGETSHGGARVFVEGLAGSAEAWLNGEPLAAAIPASGGRAFDLAGPLRGGPHALALRLEQTGADAATVLPDAVRLEWAPAARIERVFVQPDIRRRRLTVTLVTTAPGMVRLRLDETGGETLVDSQGGGPLKAFLEFPEFDCWGPENPVRYGLTAELMQGDAVADSVTTRFGMREFTIKERRFALNNRPYAIRGAAFASSAPGLRTPAALARLKAAGFNLLRVRGDALSTRLLEQCDAAGLFVWFEPVSAEDLPARLRPHANHPSLAIITLPDGAASVHEMREEDPSRLLFVSAPGGRSAAAGFVRPYHDTPEPCDYLEAFAPGPCERAVELHHQHNGSPDRLVLFGRAGLQGLPGNGAAEEAYRARGLEAVFGTPQRFLEAISEAQANALRVQIDAMRTNAKAAAYCLDLPPSVLLEPETGILTRTLRLSQVPLRLVVECDRTNICLREEVRVRVSLVNDRRVEGRADLSIQVVGPTQQVLWKKRRGVRITKAGAELWSGNLSASGTPGEHRIVARLMQGMNRVAETSVPLIVTPAATAIPVAVMSPNEHPSAPNFHRLLQEAETRAPVYILPPLANTVRAYPAEFMSEMLGEVAAGAVGIVFSPPGDWNDLAAASDTRAVTIASHAVPGGPAGAYHYARRHPVFEELPSRGLMGVAYRNVLPLSAFLDDGEQDIAGCLDANALERGSDGGEAASPWRSDIAVKRCGEGLMVFTHFRLLEHIEQDPVAARLLTNLVTHFRNRSVPAETAPIPDRGVLRWLNQEQSRVRRWMVLGMFPNFGDSGHDTAYPPESAIDLAAVYPGWYAAIGWRRWYSTELDGHALNLDAAAAPGGVPATMDDYGTAYAYAEFNHPHRDPVFLHLPERNATKCWLNGRLVFETRGDPHAGVRAPARVDGMLRQGKNTVLLKVSKAPGPLVAGIEFEAKDGRPLNLRWWR